LFFVPVCPFWPLPIIAADIAAIWV